MEKDTENDKMINAMSFTMYLKKMAYLIELLNDENPECPDCLAKKIGVSRRTIFRYMDELRLKDADISFSKSKGTYYLKNNFSFTKDFLWSAMKWHSTRLNLGVG